MSFLDAAQQNTASHALRAALSVGVLPRDLAASLEEFGQC